MRGRFFWRIGALLALFFISACIGFTVLVGLAARWLGVIDVPPNTIVFDSPFVVLALAVGLMSFFFVARALRRATRPFGDVMEAAGHIADGDYTVRVLERGPRETRALAHAFNSMATRLQANDEQRRNLLADVTHELRTPLTVIQGNLEGLLDGVYPPDEAHLKSILDETRLMSRLIDDLRTLALAESGALKLQREPADLAALTEETVASFQAQADTAEIRLGVEVAPNLPIVEIDPARIREVLENLIANALRYTPGGGRVRVTCSADQASGRAARLTVSVEDTGAGISPDDVPRVFDRFYAGRDSHGTGLGLAIAKNLVTAHGGEIEAHSEPDRGTTIRFSLPLTAE
jgi:two-component system OmpR family sensor kinase/two-component system sensor histidine kinase BaeS